VTARAQWPWPRVVVHRGGGSLAPENTLAAIRLAVERGFNAVEVDAMLPADDEPVLMHDPTLERTAGLATAVADLRASELAGIDVGSWHSTRYAGEPIPSLRQALDLCRRSQVWANVEIKPIAGRESPTGAAVASTVAQVYADKLQPPVDLSELPILSSFSADALGAARSSVEGLPRGLLVEAVPVNWHEMLDELDAVALHVDQGHLTAATARAIVDAGFGLFCYTVNDVARMRELFDWGVDAICTDRIDLIGLLPRG
jgi:glycerophosphoryl diester phosphodiesterase